MLTIHRAEELAPYAGGVLVATMGALHAGHAALIAQAHRLRSPGQRVIVSVFVNPTQFNDPSDYARYPQTLERDCEIARAHGADVVFAPAREEVYPPGIDVPVPVLPSVATEPGLEDARRPGHFAGVCQVVSRLFALTRPATALFGDKDWQQQAVIRALVAQLGLPIQIVGVATVREPDGLAMSSRNVFLSADDRSRALSISRALHAADRCATPQHAEEEMRRIVLGAGLTLEYAVVRDEETLMQPIYGDNPARALIAARTGNVRLIDNQSWSRSN